MTDLDEGMEYDEPETSTAIAVPPERLPVPNPVSGELVDPSNLAGLAVALEDLREHKRNVDAWIRRATDYFVEQTKVEGTKTLRYGGREVVVSTPDEFVVQWESLRGALLEVGLPLARVDALTKPKTVYTLDRAVEKQLRGANPQYAEILDHWITRIPKNPSAKVKS